MKTVQFLFVGTLLSLAVMPAIAGHATFSTDGQHVFAIKFETPHLFDVDIAKQSASKIDLGPLINNKAIVALSTSNSGDLLVATAQGAWSCNIDKKSCAKLCDAPKGIEFKDIAYNPKNGAILLSIRTDFDFPKKPDGYPGQSGLFLERGADKPLPVLTRRVEFLDGVTFSQDDHLFFGTRGDLWKGGISNRIDEPDVGPCVSLGAHRCVPLANLETYNGSPMQMGVYQVAVAKTVIYVHLHRMFGTGFGKIVRLPVPPDSGPDEKDSLDARLRLYAKESSSVEILADNGNYSYLCASLDGEHVFFRGGMEPDPDIYGLYLVENNGKPRKLNVQLPE